MKMLSRFFAVVVGLLYFAQAHADIEDFNLTNERYKNSQELVFGGLWQERRDGSREVRELEMLYQSNSGHVTNYSRNEHSLPVNLAQVQESIDSLRYQFDLILKIIPKKNSQGNVGIVAYDIVPSAPPEMQEAVVKGKKVKQSQLSRSSSARYELKQIDWFNVPEADGQIKKIIVVGGSFMVFTEKLKMYLFKPKSANFQSGLEKRLVNAPEKIVREILDQDVQVVAKKGPLKFYIAMNGTVLSRDVGSKVWAFDGETGKILGRERFWKPVRAIYLRSTEGRVGESDAVVVDFSGMFERRLAPLSINSFICRDISFNTKIDQNVCENL